MTKRAHEDDGNTQEVDQVKLLESCCDNGNNILLKSNLYLNDLIVVKCGENSFKAHREMVIKSSVIRDLLESCGDTKCLDLSHENLNKEGLKRFLQAFYCDDCHRKLTCASVNIWLILLEKYNLRDKLTKYFNFSLTKQCSLYPTKIVSTRRPLELNKRKEQSSSSVITFPNLWNRLDLTDNQEFFFSQQDKNKERIYYIIRFFSLAIQFGLKSPKLIEVQKIILTCGYHQKEKVISIIKEIMKDEMAQLFIGLITEVQVMKEMLELPKNDYYLRREILRMWERFIDSKLIKD